MTTLAVLQPGYLPWLGFFDQIRRSDIFVFYDDVPFDKHGWRNRNRIKTANGPAWLTVPVRHKGRMGQAINEVEIDNGSTWARKHIESIRQSYARAPYCARYLPEFAELLERRWTLLSDLDIALAKLMCGWLGLERPMLRSSELGIGGDRNGRLLALCRHFDADIYLSGNAAQNYLDVPSFEDSGVRVVWQNYSHPQYNQLHGAFEPFLSAIDLLMNLGPESNSVLTSAK